MLFADLVVCLLPVLYLFKKHGFLTGLGGLFMAFGAFVFIWYAYLESTTGSYRGMEALVFLIMWVVSAVSFVVGLLIYRWSKKLKRVPTQSSS